MSLDKSIKLLLTQVRHLLEHMSWIGRLREPDIVGAGSLFLLKQNIFDIWFRTASFGLERRGIGWGLSVKDTLFDGRFLDGWLRSSEVIVRISKSSHSISEESLRIYVFSRIVFVPWVYLRQGQFSLHLLCIVLHLRQGVSSRFKYLRLLLKNPHGFLDLLFQYPLSRVHLQLLILIESFL